MIEFILFCIPSLAYLLVQGSRKRLGRGEALKRVGATWGTGRTYIWALLLLIPLGILGYSAIILVPAEALTTPGVSVARVTSLSAVASVFLRALGEEIFFRGLLGGIFFRRLGFARGNVLQAMIFLAPHLVLLLVNINLWPILPVQFVAGLLLGWLRHKSGSVLPGALVHAVANVGAGLLAA